MNKVFVKIGAYEYDTDAVSVPSDRTFRGAWNINTAQNQVVVNMDFARNIWRDKIRQARAGEFDALDAEFMKALETGADTSAIVAKKRALRDATAHPDIDAASTPEELKAVKPANLKIK